MKGIYLGNNFDINYVAEFVEIKEFRPHSNPEVTKLKCCKVHGFNVITNIDSKPGIYIYFPVECCINKDFLRDNNLYRNSALNKDRTTIGIFDDKGRVKAIKLKGEISEGFVIPVDSLSEYINNIELYSKKITLFNMVNNMTLCEKYSPNKKKDLFKKDNIMKDQFHYHVNTIQLKRMPHMITPDSLIQISIKTNGSSGISANLKVKRPLHQSLFDKILKRKKYKEEYYTFFASRSMIQDSVLSEEIGEYSEDRKKIHNLLFKGIPKGLSVYYEILGYWSDGTPIQGKWDYGFTKPESSNCWEYGKNFGVEVYRITYTNSDGIVHEFSARQVRQYCRRVGWTPVEEVYYGYAKDLYPDISTQNDWNDTFLERLSNDKNFYMEMSSPRCINKVPNEGIVIRNETLNIEVYKIKCFNFLQKEREMLDSGEINIEDIS